MKQTIVVCFHLSLWFGQVGMGGGMGAVRLGKYTYSAVWSWYLTDHKHASDIIHEIE